MAGIGFELKKLFKKDSVVATVLGGMYAIVVTIGPTILVILALNLMYYVLPYARVSYYDKEVLSSTILYVFIFSLLLSGPVNILLSRYIADKIFEEKYEVLGASLEYGARIIAILVALLGIPFSFLMYFRGKFTITYIVVAYIFFAGLAFTFYLMAFVTILKEYKKITLGFLVGLTLGILVSLAVYFWLHFSATRSILFGLASGFNFIAVFLYLVVRRTFPKCELNSKEIRKYAWKHKKIILANFFYLLGLYVHNFVFWFKSEFKVIIAKVYICAPVYDEATFLAMLTSLSFLVIFVINVETKFHTAYQNYCQSIIGAGKKNIRETRDKMNKTLCEELLSIIRLQFIIIIVVFLVALIALPQLGMGGTIMDIYPLLSVGYFLIYLTQGMMIFLFYIDDSTGTLIAGLILSLGIFFGSLVSVHFSSGYCGAGVVFGGFCSFTFLFFRIKYMFNHLDEYIFCRGAIIKRAKTENVENVQYDNAQKEKNGNVTVFKFNQMREGKK